MILSDLAIKKWLDSGELKISELQPHSLQPASVELHLGGKFSIMTASPKHIHLDQDNSELFDDYVASISGKFVVPPGGFVLAHTVERVKIPNGLVARVEGKSSLGRMGLAIHVTAGFIDPGFEGQITLELVNLSPNFLVIKEGMKIAQLCVMQMSSKSSQEYGHEKFGSHYQGQTGATVAAAV